MATAPRSGGRDRLDLVPLGHQRRVRPTDVVGGNSGDGLPTKEPVGETQSNWDRSHVRTGPRGRQRSSGGWSPTKGPPGEKLEAGGAAGGGGPPVRDLRRSRLAGTEAKATGNRALWALGPASER